MDVTSYTTLRDTIISFMDVLLAGPKHTRILAQLMPSGGVHSTGYAAFKLLPNEAAKAANSLRLAFFLADARRNSSIIKLTGSPDSLEIVSILAEGYLFDMSSRSRSELRMHATRRDDLAKTCCYFGTLRDSPNQADRGDPLTSIAMFKA